MDVKPVNPPMFPALFVNYSLQLNGEGRSTESREDFTEVLWIRKLPAD